MIYWAPLAGYFLLVSMIMFGGRKKRQFSQASQAAAGVVVTLLSLASILWFLCAFISQLVSAEH